ncbi:MAG: hypothetical protein AAGA86_13580, partial [Bacteroidota bacterium]
LDNSRLVRIQMRLDPRENKFIGALDIVNKGYPAVELHKQLQEKDEEAYITEFEEKVGGDFLITSYELVDERTDRQKVSQRLKFDIEDALKGNMFYLDPFLFKFFAQNPFQLSKRSYPIDFGYPRSYKYQFSLPIPEGYVIEELPKSRAVAVEGQRAILRFSAQSDGKQARLSFTLTLKASYFSDMEYESLKALFADVVDIQKNSLIVLRKKTAAP